jgi:hypothetical protein
MSCDRSIVGENPVRPVWRWATVDLPYSLCATCCWSLVKLLDSDLDEAMRFTKECERKALLINCPAGGTA